jgi:hypothetical protein
MSELRVLERGLASSSPRKRGSTPPHLDSRVRGNDGPTRKASLAFAKLDIVQCRVRSRRWEIGKELDRGRLADARQGLPAGDEVRRRLRDASLHGEVGCKTTRILSPVAISGYGGELERGPQVFGVTPPNAPSLTLPRSRECSQGRGSFTHLL